MDIKTLIVDDEYPAREEIRYNLQNYDDIVVVGEAATSKEAEALINAIDYDLVFLDINFPVGNGIDLGKKIAAKENAPMIIYVTAYDQYALGAFEVNAVDYILKPIDPEKFARAVGRARYLAMNASPTPAPVSESDEPERPAASNQSQGPMTRISAELNGKIQLVDVHEIQYAYVEQNYVFIKRDNDRLITRYNLSALEEKLDAMDFFRTNRSYLVNLNKVKEISPFFKGTCHLIMSDKENSEIPVSRRQVRRLKEIFDF